MSDDQAIPTWEKVISVLECVGPPEEHRSKLNEIYRMLQSGPLDLKRGSRYKSTHLHKWWILWHTSERAAPRVRELSQDGLVRREVVRTTAWLALLELRSRQEARMAVAGTSGAVAEPKLITDEELRHALGAWIRLLTDDESLPFETYLTTFRQSAHRSLPGDVRLIELQLLDLHNPGGAVVFGIDAELYLLPIAKWAARRYDFGYASAISRQFRGDKALSRKRTSREWTILAFNRTCLPRLFFAVLLGHFAVATQDSAMRFLQFCSNDICRTIAFCVAVAFVSFGLVFWDVYCRVPSRRKRCTSWYSLYIFGVGVVQSAVIGAVAVCMYTVAQLTAEGQSVVRFDPSDHNVSLWLVESATALVIGYLLQIIWSDRAVSEGIHK